ncbi:hypothetical protein M9Y10_025771 [Tritrichomonas musculus]|uniref:Uncharacterized protein n=1 Tax=Tritrichomonas musculus TaxID=1915356 RepID=A0ABR2H9L0_9EUKA
MLKKDYGPAEQPEPNKPSESKLKTVFEAKNVETPIVNVQPQTYSTIKEMKITKSIEVDSGSITLNKCNLADGINISMKKDLSWPQISLVDTTINPEAIDIDVGLLELI